MANFKKCRPRFFRWLGFLTLTCFVTLPALAVIDGTTVNVNDFPWIQPLKIEQIRLDLHWGDWSYKSRKYLTHCTAIAISSNTFLTARHCGLGTKSAAFYVGKSLNQQIAHAIIDHPLTYLDDHKTEAPIQGLVNAQSDLATFTFAEPLVIDPLPPERRASSLPWNSEVTMIGFGLREPLATDAAHDKFVEYTIAASKDKTFNNYEMTQARFVLTTTPRIKSQAGFLGAFQLDAESFTRGLPNSGDSGAPVIDENGRLIAMVSYMTDDGTLSHFQGSNYGPLYHSDALFGFVNLSSAGSVRFIEKTLAMENKRPGVCCRCQRQLMDANNNPMQKDTRFLLHITSENASIQNGEAEKICGADVHREGFTNSSTRFAIESCEVTQRADCNAR